MQVCWNDIFLFSDEVTFKEPIYTGDEDDGYIEILLKKTGKKSGINKGFICVCVWIMEK